MSTTLIRKLFESRLKTWAAARSPALRIAFENAQFTPGTTETYLRCFTLPARTASNDLEGIHRLYTGIWQVNIVSAAGAGAGTGVLSGIAEELETLFPQNLQLTDGTFMVAVREPMGPGPLIIDGNTSTMPVSCRYRADVAL
jgi:hypothetical protein